MERKIKLYCKKRLSDRDFLFGVFSENGVAKKPDELFNIPGEIPFREQDANECGSEGATEEGPAF